MLVSLLMVAALAGGSDVSATATISRPATDVVVALSDLRTLRDITPAHCATRWIEGPSTAGVGARAAWTLRAGAWRERVVGVIVAADDRRVDVEQRDSRGEPRFTTRFEVRAEGAGARVTVTTYLEPPPWPLARAFERRVRPAWQACHQAQLDGLARGAR